MLQSSLFSTVPVNGVDVPVHKIVPTLSQVRYITRNNAQHIFSIDNADGTNLVDITIAGPNGTIHLTKHQFNGGASMFGTKLESLAEPTASDDAATKNYVDTAIANNGGGDSNKLVDENGVVRVEAKTNGIEATGISLLKQEQGKYFFEYLAKTGNQANKRLFRLIDYGGPIKAQMRWGRGFQFYGYDSSDMNGHPIMNINYDGITSEQIHTFNEALNCVGTLLVTQERRKDFFQYKDENDELVVTMIAWDDNVKLRTRHDNPVQMQCYNSDNSAVKTPIEYRYQNSWNEWAVKLTGDVLMTGSLEALATKFSYTEIENPAGGSFLKLGTGTTTNFEFKNRSNQNQIIVPSDHVLQFVFDNNGSQTTALSLGNGLSYAYSDFVFNSYVKFNQQIDMNNKKITNLAAPTSGSDAATRDYVDTASFGIDRVSLGEYMVLCYGQ